MLGFAVSPGTRAEAQRLLDAAAEEFLASGANGRYTVWYDDGRERATVAEGRFDIDALTGHQLVMISPGEPDTAIETLLIEADSWTRTIDDGEAGPCWIHLSRGGDGDAKYSAVLPGAWPLLEPKAQGRRADAGSDGGFVIDLLLEEALPLAVPALANRIGPIDPAARVPAVLTLADGDFSSLEFRVADAFTKQAELDPAFVSTLAGLGMGGIASLEDIQRLPRTWFVEVRYDDLGASPSTVEAPPEAAVMSVDAEAALDPSPGASAPELCADGR